jgi:hypothetical protein
MLCADSSFCLYAFLSSGDVLLKVFDKRRDLVTEEKYFNVSGIWGSHGGKRGNGRRLGCSTVRSGASLPTFRWSLLPPSSGRWVLMMEAVSTLLISKFRTAAMFVIVKTREATIQHLSVQVVKLITFHRNLSLPFPALKDVGYVCLWIPCYHLCTSWPISNFER